MNRVNLNVPEGVRYIYQWTDFKNFLPKGGKLILNKSLPDCGASSWFLKNEDDIVLASPRISMLTCKERDIQGVFWFRSTTSVQELENYKICRRISGLPIKIVVTYDSLHLVLSYVDLNTTTIVIDEMQCLIGDAAFKGDTVLDVVSVIQNIPNIIYLSATVYEDTYLDNLDIFKDVSYIKLVWPDTATRPIQAQLIKIGSIRAKVKEIIERFKKDGYFECKMISGQPVYATQGVFFLNSISDITGIIKSLNLKPEEVNIICSTLKENKLKKIKFMKGDPPKRGEVHKPITFVTKASFEGSDFYSTCAYTYIFCDPTLKNMALDLYIDVPQIMGRQRLENNPFKYDATIFYKTSLDYKTEDEFFEMIKNKEEATKVTIDLFNKNTDPKVKESILTLTEDAHSAVGFSKNYLSVVEDSSGNKSLHENFMVKVAETRAWQIQSEQYRNDIRILSTLQSGGIDQITSVITPNSQITTFTNEFAKDNNFERRMKLYCDFRDNYPIFSEMLEATTYIPIEYHQYYRFLGSSLIKSFSYKEADIKKELEFRHSYDQLKKIFDNLFKLNSTYSAKDIKQCIQKVYDNLGMKKTAKSTDLNDFYTLQPTMAYISGKRVKVIRILPLNPNN